MLFLRDQHGFLRVELSLYLVELLFKHPDTIFKRTFLYLGHLLYQMEIGFAYLTNKLRLFDFDSLRWEPFVFFDCSIEA